MSKKMITMICLILVIISSITFAGSAEVAYNSIAYMINRVLSILSWFGYAIATAMLIIMGIKYTVCSTNEKARLKEMAPKYITGVALVVMCSTLAATIAGIASGGKNKNTAEGLVDFGFNYAGISVVDKLPGRENMPGGTAEKIDPTIKNNLVVSASDGADVQITINGKDSITGDTFSYDLSQYEKGKVANGTKIELVAEPTSDHGWAFQYWALVDADGNEIEVISNSLNTSYIMPKDDLYVQAIYVDPATTPTIPNDSESGKIYVSGANGNNKKEVKVSDGAKFAVLAVTDENLGKVDISVRNLEKSNAEGSKLVNGDMVGNTNGNYTTKGMEIGEDATNGEYNITIDTDTGMESKKENIKIYRYDSKGNKEEVSFLYEYAFGAADVIVENVDVFNYSYVVVVTEEGLTSN